MRFWKLIEKETLFHLGALCARLPILARKTVGQVMAVFLFQQPVRGCVEKNELNPVSRGCLATG